MDRLTEHPTWLKNVIKQAMLAGGMQCKCEQYNATTLFYFCAAGIGVEFAPLRG